MAEKYSLFRLNEHLVDAQRHLDMARADLVQFRFALEQASAIVRDDFRILSEKSDSIRNVLYADEIIVKKSGDGRALDIRALMHDVAEISMRIK